MTTSSVKRSAANGNECVGERLEVTLDRPAHGGYVVGRHQGRVVFVRHAIAGERAIVEVTQGGNSSRMWRADAIEILVPSPDRVSHPWPQAGPGGVGGADLGHVALPAQREWKAQVISENLRRFAKVEPEVHVAALPCDDERNGLHYRTRIDAVVSDSGRLAMRRARSHNLVELDDMPLASETILAYGPFEKRWQPGDSMHLVANHGAVHVAVNGKPVSGAPASITERVRCAGDVVDFRVSITGFWQVHERAAETLVDSVIASAEIRPGDMVWDLYSGVGLFSAFAAYKAGPTGAVMAVEADHTATHHARGNLSRFTQAHVFHSTVSRAMGRLASSRAPDVVVMDPPRKGAGIQVMQQTLDQHPRRLVHVACDPVALARDLAVARAAGYELLDMKAFDLFPHTHHVECIATLERAR